MRLERLDRLSQGSSVGFFIPAARLIWITPNQAGRGIFEWIDRELAVGINLSEP